MINILSSDAELKSESFQKVERKDGQDNIEWLKAFLPEDPSQAVLVMVGGRTPMDLRLRIAQGQVRSDLAPSKWSHVMLLKNPSKREASAVYEISLEPFRGFQFPTPENGIQEGELGRYGDPERYPNIAVLKVPVPQEDVEAALDRFKKQRAVLDGVDLIVRWLAYVWGVGRSVNPLLDGFGIPSAAMLEIVIGAAGFDLTPGLESRSSCPEAISQAAKYWHEYYEDQQKTALSGFYYDHHHIE
jgi:hypothetical protein